MRERVAIFFVSVAIIGFQLAIINLLSYSQWHHFAYLAVSIAMLGFGSSGVILSVWSKYFKENAEQLLPLLFLATGLLMFLSPLVINLPLVRFDTFLLFTSTAQVFKLLLSCFVLFLPFLLGATVIGLLFMIRSKHIPLLYAWNLAGSALGGIMLVLLSSSILPMNLSALFGFFSVFSGILIAKTSRLKLLGLFVGVIGGVVLWFQPSIPNTSEFKAISKTLLIPETRVEDRQPLRQGTYELVVSENLRQAHGLSLNYIGTVPHVDIAFLNGQPYFSFEKGELDTLQFHQNIYYLPYYLGETQNIGQVLLLQPPSTSLAAQAVFFGARATVVEPIKPVAWGLKAYPWVIRGVEVVESYPREFLYGDTDNWELVLFPVIGGVGGAGLSALQEQYLFTSNALEKAFLRLSGNGKLLLSSNMDTPPRNSLKLLTMAVEGLRNMGFDPAKHLVAIRSWNTLLVLLSPVPFTEGDIEKVNEFALELGFDMVHPEGDFEINMLSDSTFAILAHDIIWDKSFGSASEYAFNLRPPSDNSPFFSQFMKLSQLRNYFRWYGRDGVPFLELGYFIVWASLLVCLLLGLVAIAFPLFASMIKKELILSIWVYFSLLGLGYMLLEVSLIQRSILTLGNPVTASAVIISALLCFSAVGSYYSSRLNIKRTLPYILTLIAVLLASLALWGNHISSTLVQFPLILRVVLLVLSILPLAVLMGMAFPMGMKRLSESYPDQIPVAWGVNGFFSVLAAPLATIIAVEAGFLQVLMLSAVLYLLCIISAKMFVR